MSTRTCPTCSQPIPADAPGGFCPACLLREADEPFSSGNEAPSVEEIAAAFPNLKVIRLLGRGGMGFVYEARQNDLERTVAIKVLSPQLGTDPTFAERFAREARILAKLQHPNIVTLFEHGEQGGFYYLLMEHVDGVNLRQAMQAGRFTPEQALAIVPAICDALQTAHTQGIWHRDIKPENILLDKEGRVKIADFGIARILGDPARNFTLTQTGNALGSSAYMAPEQFEDPRKIDHRSDIYSLGVVLYEMLTGELPLGRFPTPSQRAAVDARIDEIVLRTLEKERELRQQSATQVKAELQDTSASPAASNLAGSSFDHSDKYFLWSLGLWLGGFCSTFLAGSFARILANFTGTYNLSPSPFLFRLGGFAAFFGFIGCLWILCRIRHDKHPIRHRTPLLVLVFWPAVLLLTAGWLGLVFESHQQSFDFRGEIDRLTSAPPLVILAAIMVPSILVRFLWGQCAKPRASRSHRWPAILATTIALTSIVGLHFVTERINDFSAYFGARFTLEDTSPGADERSLLEHETAINQAARAALGSNSQLSPRVLSSMALGGDASEESYQIYVAWRSSIAKDAEDFARRYQVRLVTYLPNGISITRKTLEDQRQRFGGRPFREFIPIFFLVAFVIVFLLAKSSWISIGLTSALSLITAGLLLMSDWPKDPSELPPFIVAPDSP